jgi:hypothetical protein
MTAPTPEAPATTVSVLGMLSMPVDDPTDGVAAAVAAVNALVRGWLRPVATGVDGAEEWNPTHVFGATMLAARLYRRRDSPAGVLPFGEEGAAYVSRNDPDVALLLQMGSYAPPRVG